jgi:hypothetical protein
MDTTIYSLLIFLHVAGALGIAATYALEMAALVGLRRSTEAIEARIWLRARRWVLRVGPPSIGLVLATGIYAVYAGWGWLGWMLVALVSVLGLALIGGLLTGIPMARLEPGIEKAVGPLADDLRNGLRSRVLSISIAARMAITLGVAFLMVRKPHPVAAVMVIVIAGIIGVAVGAAFGAGASRPAAALDKGEAGRS